MRTEKYGMSFGGKEMSSNWIVIIVAQPSEYIWNYCTVHLKKRNVMIRKLNFNLKNPQSNKLCKMHNILGCILL